MQSQQNIFFVDIFDGKLLKRFILILACGQFCLIWCEVIKTIREALASFNHLPEFPCKTTHPETPELKHDGMLPFILNFENDTSNLTLELSSSE